jgi:hypothetical protein
MKNQLIKIILSLPILLLTLMQISCGGSSTTGSEEENSTVDNQSFGIFPISVKPTGWGDASPVDIEAVVDSVAETLAPHFRGLTLDTILLENSHRDSSPITLFRRGANNEYLVRVDINGRLWSKLSYQFSHEMCHVLSNYEKTQDDKHQWFEESLCEAVSLFTLAGMAKNWQVNPPYPNWKSYSAALQQYLDNNLAEQHRYLPAGYSHAEWYADNISALQKNAVDRAKNEVVGTAIYGIMLIDNNLLSGIRYLNLGAKDKSTSFSVYLRDWYQKAPQKSKPSILRVLQLFQIEV